MTSLGDDGLTRLDARTGRIEARLRVGQRPYGLDVDGDASMGGKAQ